jgi:hypothetical protein
MDYMAILIRILVIYIGSYDSQATEIRFGVRIYARESRNTEGVGWITDESCGWDFGERRGGGA